MQLQKVGMLSSFIKGFVCNIQSFSKFLNNILWEKVQHFTTSVHIIVHGL